MKSLTSHLQHESDPYVADDITLLQRWHPPICSLTCRSWRPSWAFPLRFDQSPPWSQSQTQPPGSPGRCTLYMIIHGYSLECLTCPQEDGTQSRSLRGEEPFWSFAISPVLLAPKRRIISGSIMSILNLFLLDQFLDIIDVKAVLDLSVFLHI